MSAAVDLILGAVRGLEYPLLHPFVESLRRTGFSGELSLFITGVSERTAQELRARGVVVHAFREPHLRFTRGRRLYFYDDRVRPLHVLLPLASGGIGWLFGSGSRLQLATARRMMGVWCSRYFLYYEYLRRRPDRFRNVMIADVKDVVFQRDPFDLPLEAPLQCFLESRRYRVGTCPINRALVETACGSEALEEIAAEPISCSGVTMGSYPAMLEYLRLMTESLRRLRRQYGGIDQGIHNVLLHTGRIPGAKPIENGAGAVATLGYVRPEEMHFDSAGWLLGTDGSIVPVLHQYDRHPDLQGQILNRYAASA